MNYEYSFSPLGPEAILMGLMKADMVVTYHYQTDRVGSNK